MKPFFNLIAVLGQHLNKTDMEKVIWKFSTM